MLLFLVAAIIVLVAFAISGPLGAPWVPARKKDVEGIMNDIKLQKGQTYIELGCGDGRLVAAAARQGAIAIGYEINPILYIVATLRNVRNPSAHVRFGNFWKKDLSSATVVMAFLMPKFMLRLESKVNTELKPSAKLICYVFPLPTKKPSIKRHHWFVYTF